MKVTVDPVACEANAFCVRLVPRVFSLHEAEDGEDVLVIADDGEFSPELADEIRGAVARCPKAALSLLDLGQTGRTERPRRRPPPRLGRSATVRLPRGSHRCVV